MWLWSKEIIRNEPCAVTRLKWVIITFWQIKTNPLLKDGCLVSCGDGQTEVSAWKIFLAGSLTSLCGQDCTHISTAHSSWRKPWQWYAPSCSNLVVVVLSKYWHQNTSRPLRALPTYYYHGTYRYSSNHHSSQGTSLVADVVERHVVCKHQMTWLGDMLQHEWHDTNNMSPTS